MESAALVALFVALCLLTWALVKMGTTDGDVDYCWIEVTATKEGLRPTFTLMGHRPWRTDAKMSLCETFDDAAKAAERASCPLHK